MQSELKRPLLADRVSDLFDSIRFRNLRIFPPNSTTLFIPTRRPIPSTCGFAATTRAHTPSSALPTTTRSPRCLRATYLPKSLTHFARLGDRTPLISFHTQHRALDYSPQTLPLQQTIKHHDNPHKRIRNHDWAYRGPMVRRRDGEPPSTSSTSSIHL